jgi:hypothetical protein
MGAAIASFILGIFLTGDRLGPVALIWFAVAVAACTMISRLRIINNRKEGEGNEEAKHKCAVEH